MKSVIQINKKVASEPKWSPFAFDDETLLSIDFEEVANDMLMSSTDSLIRCSLKTLSIILLYLKLRPSRINWPH